MPYSQLDRPEILASLFHPGVPSPTALPPGARDLTIAVEPGINIGCRFHATDPAAPILLYFHGSRETVADHDSLARQFNDLGINLLVTDYRGYGWSDGSPSVAAMMNDARILFQEGRNWWQEQGFSGPLFLLGRSLGSACAIDLAARFSESIKGLIIESGFADTLPLLRALGLTEEITGITEENGFNNLAKIALVTKPTFILHGARDSLIPAVEAEKLQSFCGAKNKEFQVVPGADHHTLRTVAGKLYFQAIRQFMDKITGVSSWRKRRRTQQQSEGEV
jgi:pimeloyl-ACP methyl ester carboxylesterase